MGGGRVSDWVGGWVTDRGGGLAGWMIESESQVRFLADSPKFRAWIIRGYACPAHYASMRRFSRRWLQLAHSRKTSAIIWGMQGMAIIVGSTMMWQGDWI